MSPRKEEYDVGEMDRDQLAQMLADKLYECEQCGQPHEGTVADLEYGWTPDRRMGISAEFQCPRCGWNNRNTAFLGE